MCSQDTPGSMQVQIAEAKDVEVRRPSLMMRAQVLSRTGIKSVSSLYKLMSDGRFPRPLRTSANTVAWIASEVDEWVVHTIRSSTRVEYCEGRRS